MNARRLRRRLARALARGPSEPAAGARSGSATRAAAEHEGSLSMDLEGDSRTLLIAFGGIAGEQLGKPAFEFSRASEQLPVKRLMVRDLRQGWYHRGIPEYGDTLLSVADGLRALVSELEVERLVMAGNSAGAYAACVFGTLLGADTVLCFAPQTVLELDALAAIGDHRWDEQLGAVSAEGALDTRWSDLRRALVAAGGGDRAEREGRGGGRGGTRYQVYFDDTLLVDRLHAERLRGLDGVRLYRFGRGRHRLVRELREAGALERVLRQALGLGLPA